MSFYPRLADELKLMIWEFSSMSPGVHHFNLKPLSRFNFVRLQPIANNDGDPSAWRERRALDESCILSKETLDRLLTDQKPIYRDLSQRRVHLEENGIQAVIDGKTDLVVLHFLMDHFDLRMRAPYVGRTLVDVAHIGINWKTTQSRGWGALPAPVFKCLCIEGHEDLHYCPAALVEFIQFLPDLKVFYFVNKITAQDINPYLQYIPKDGEVASAEGDATEATEGEAASRGKKRDIGGAVKGGQAVAKKKRRSMDKRPVAERMRDIVERLRGPIKHDGLAIFQDRKGTYYEIRVEDAEQLLSKDQATQFWNLMLELRGEWEYNTQNNTDINDAEKQRRLKIEFKILIYVEAKYINIPKPDNAQGAEASVASESAS